MLIQRNTKSTKRIEIEKQNNLYEQYRKDRS